MKIVVFGKNGQVGKELQKLNWDTQWDVRFLQRSDANFDDPKKIIDLVNDCQPDIVINVAAYTNVDLAETELAQTNLVNAIAPCALAIACQRLAVPLIHMSTDYVFDGTKRSPYLEEDETSPLSIYGKSKELGERVIRSVCNQHVILRSAWVYSIHGKNFFKTMISLGAKHEELNIVMDQVGSPTSAEAIAQAILKIVHSISEDKNNWGTYHFCSSGQASWYDFAAKIFELSNPFTHRLPDLNRIASKDFPMQAARPHFSVLDCSKISRDFGVLQKPWEEQLSKVVQDYFSEESMSQ